MYPNIIIDEHEFLTKNSFGHDFFDFIETNKITRKTHCELKLKGDHFFLFNNVNVLNLNNIGDIVCGNTVIEIKNEELSNDYSISMHSGHLDEQMDDMFENSKFKYRYLFVLGEMKDNDFYFTKLQSKHIIGRSFEDKEQLIYWILYTIMYNNSGITPYTAFDYPKYRPAWTFLKNVPGVGRKKAEAIIKTLFYVNTLEDVMHLTVNDLTSVHGIGKSTANQILDYVHNKSPSRLWDELNSKEYRQEIWDSLVRGEGL